ncbi:MAG: ABC transporter permease [Planctomycetota bacterium]|nr:ABC transporter permease [Planctomycetota bacterium]
MDLVNSLRIGLKGLSVHKVRAALSMLGIIFGVASVVAVIAVSQGARGEMVKQLAALGANNVIVKGIDWRSQTPEERKLKKSARLRSEGLTRNEARVLAESCDLIDAHAPWRRVFATVRKGEEPVAAEVVGTTPAFLGVMNFNLLHGRFLNPADETAARRVCVIEQAIGDEIFSDVDTPVGQVLAIDHEPYFIVGVLKSKEVTEEKFDVAQVRRLNRRIYIPLEAALRRTTQAPLDDEVTQVVYHCRDTAEVRSAEALIRRFYETAHGMEGRPLEERDYEIVVSQDLLQQVEQAQQIFNIVMLCSAGISLVVGGIGIMNIMLANVSERRREVGIRRAVGATKADILKQFLFESLIICLVGGILGCVMGIGFTILVHHWTGWQVSLAVWGMIVAVGVSLLDGVIFGTFPAWKAATLDPIDALRYE